MWKHQIPTNGPQDHLGGELPPLEAVAPIHLPRRALSNRGPYTGNPPPAKFATEPHIANKEVDRGAPFSAKQSSPATCGRVCRRSARPAVGIQRTLSKSSGTVICVAGSSRPPLTSICELSPRVGPTPVYHFDILSRRSASRPRQMTAQRTSSESLMSMYRASGNPRNRMVSCRCTRSITLEFRFFSNCAILRVRRPRACSDARPAAGP